LLYVTIDAVIIRYILVDNITDSNNILLHECLKLLKASEHFLTQVI